MRRLRFVVDFPLPTAGERKRIWEQVFPAEAGTARLDYDRLARFDINGGSIRSIALDAAFLAAQSTGPVTMPLILEAARKEFRKLARPVNEADFR